MNRIDRTAVRTERLNSSGDWPIYLNSSALHSAKPCLQGHPLYSIEMNLVQ